MKKLPTTITMMMLMTLGIIITSCDNSDDIGNLYGQWKLEKVEYNGTTTLPNTLFLEFQSSYVQAGEANPETHGVLHTHGHYTSKGGEMLMTFYHTDGLFPIDPEIYPGTLPIDPDAIAATDPFNPAVPLKSFSFYHNGTERTQEEQQLGIYPIHLAFTIETLTSSTLILHDKANPANTWYLKKN